jgi:hypothetical protein
MKVHTQSRRSFLGMLAAAAPLVVAKQKVGSDLAFRFAVAGCEFDLTVKPYGKVSSGDLEFIDKETQRRFCVPTNGRSGGECVAEFRGAMAVAQYKFYPSFPRSGPAKLRERVITIDHDSRLNPRAPVDEYVAIEDGAASDIQAFGFAPDNPMATGSLSKFVSPWALMRQDLYFDDQKAPILILHWKHTLESIGLVDVIPGDRTRVVSA